MKKLWVEALKYPVMMAVPVGKGKASLFHSFATNAEQGDGIARAIAFNGFAMTTGLCTVRTNDAFVGLIGKIVATQIANLLLPSGGN